ncbi:MAG: hypothetical protein Ct9H90mP7_3400 [Candidatus Neomarinimicrobiota bacterium]|nr:MAG: hypothetical protein Ct9H90mP7_3400 [Candidatus Neomarinimicrobiota bacterium]
MPLVMINLLISIQTFLKGKDRSYYMKPFYVTTPIYYVNDKPILVMLTPQFLLMCFHVTIDMGRNVFFLTG